MKNYLITIAILLACITFTGCATADKMLLRTPPATITPAVPVDTNSTTGAVTYSLPVTNQPPPIVNPAITGTISTLESFTPVIPAPFGTAATAALTLLSALLGAYATARSKNQSIAQWKNVAGSIIQGVESAGTAAAAVKQAIAKTASANGNADAVENAVNALTGSQ